MDSVRAQTFGRYTVILCKHTDIDLSDLTKDLSGAIAAFVEIPATGGGRAETLSVGLLAVRSEFFAILDDDDFWLRDHVESLFLAGRTVDPEFDVVFSGTVCVSEQGKRIETSLVWHRNIWTFGFPSPPRSISDVTNVFSSNCFVARSELIKNVPFEIREMESAEDSFLIAMITRRKRPVFSYKATAFFRRSHPSQSNFDRHQSRKTDLVCLELCTGLLLSPIWLNSASIPSRRLAEIVRDEQDEEGSQIDPLLESLGEPRLAEDLAEGWDVMGRMLVGTAGVGSPGGIACRGSATGYVCYGPYLQLPPGSYRVDFSIVGGRLATPISGRAPSRPAGQVDVICFEAGWEGGVKDFAVTDRVVSVGFEIPRELAGSIEFRVASLGGSDFEVTSIFLWRTS